jgi:hypothetical protein
MLAALAGLLQAQDLTDDLLTAARKGDFATVKSLLDRGADVNAKSPYGSTALLFASDHGHAEVVKLLLDRGADPNIEDTFYHQTALSWAAQKRRPEIAKLLLDKGARPSPPVFLGWVQAGNAELVKAALAKNSLDQATLSKALTAAASKPEIAEALKAAGAEPLKTVQLDVATLTGYAGTYTATFSGMELEMSFIVKDGNLSGTLSNQRAVTYAPSDQTHFQSIEVPGVEVEFTSGGFQLKQGGLTLEFKRKGQPK